MDTLQEVFPRSFPRARKAWSGIGRPPRRRTAVHPTQLLICRGQEAEGVRNHSSCPQKGFSCPQEGFYPTYPSPCCPSSEAVQKTEQLKTSPSFCTRSAEATESSFISFCTEGSAPPNRVEREKGVFNNRERYPTFRSGVRTKFTRRSLTARAAQATGIIGSCSPKKSEHPCAGPDGYTPSYLTGPEYAAQGDWYMIFETSGNVQENDTAVLRTELIQIENTSCLYFYYHMYGEDMGTLAIYTEMNMYRSKLWTESGNQGILWHFEKITIPAGTQRIIIEGTDGIGVTGDMALDYIVLLDKECPQDDSRSTAQDYNIRLIGGDKASFGRVEIAPSNDFAFQALCTSNWAENNSEVLCRQLGFGPDNIYTRTYLEGEYASIRTWKFPLADIAFYCNGSEKLLSECRTEKDKCTAKNQVAVACSDNACFAGEIACISPRIDHVPANATCVKEEKWCDGKVDCPKAEDEHYCGNCSNDHYECDNHKCVSLSERCDGKNDCGDWSDEHFCVKINDDFTVQVNYHGEWFSICLPDPDRNLAGYLCALATSGSFLSFPVSTITSNDTMTISYVTNSEGVIRSHSLQPTNRACAALKLECRPQECGRSVLSPVDRVIGGYDTPLRLFPSMIALMKNSTTFQGQYCGASLISPNYVITAAHCVDDYEDGIYYLLGSFTDFNNLDEQGLRMDIAEVINHPNSDIRDVSLLKLTKPVAESDTLSTVCLPPPSRDIFSYDTCHVLGWGITEYGVGAERLEMLQVDLLLEEDAERCGDYMRLYFDLILPHVVCIDNREKHSPICNGDSGGPLLCKNQQGRLELVGITSFGARSCLNSEFTDVYENIMYYLDFIYDNTDLER
ncbi:atrial natriuretic peptide-converting enzyme-like [Ylistrum balloti]|uniref:atrial natriuretic peptide-converting enzyme-like n=1 Tax=Ylistrum balloti TaxID=509963 RepID=UPI002905AF43|nr:atrial natriuretic peptide-converting enzyme-like [Ylistrum balloti]